jgi:hypothetical protein
VSIVQFLMAGVICAVVAAPGYAGTVATVLPPPADLQLDARRAQLEGKPIVLMFSFPGCSFCHDVRQNYLIPLLRDLPMEDRPIIREIEITSTQNFIGFDGVRIDHQSFAKKLSVRFAPTVMFLDPQGRLLTQPIVGGDVTGLYGGVLDNAFAEAKQKLSAVTRNDSRGEAKP